MPLRALTGCFFVSKAEIAPFKFSYIVFCKGCCPGWMLDFSGKRLSAANEFSYEVGENIIIIVFRFVKWLWVVSPNSEAGS